MMEFDSGELESFQQIEVLAYADYVILERYKFTLDHLLSTRIVATHFIISGRLLE